MTSVPLGLSAYNRTYGQEPEVQLLNRFFEESPTNQVERSVFLARPGNTFLTTAGEGPIRVLAHQPGAFNGDLFFVSGNALFRYNGTTITPITGVISGTGKPSVTIVALPGSEHLFITDGFTLQFYDGEAAATGTLTVAGGSIVDADTVTLDTVFYKWTSGSVDAGAPAGTVSDPFLLELGGDDTASMANLILALNNTGTPGTQYSTAITTNHLTVEGVSSDDTIADVKSRTRGVVGNSIATTETGANISWGAATLEGGGAQSLNGVVTPDDIGMISLTNLAGFVLAAQVNSQRFYWIQPGAVIIDALDFAEAESEPDEIIEMVRVGDSVYILGQSSTEVWYATATLDPDASPFLRQQGLAFSQGAQEGTAVQIRTQLVVVAEDLKVYQIVGGPKRLSQNGIEERIRIADNAAAVATVVVPNFALIDDRGRFIIDDQGRFIVAEP